MVKLGGITYYKAEQLEAGFESGNMMTSGNEIIYSVKNEYQPTRHITFKVNHYLIFTHESET